MGENKRRDKGGEGEKRRRGEENTCFGKSDNFSNHSIFGEHGIKEVDGDGILYIGDVNK